MPMRPAALVGGAHRDRAERAVDRAPQFVHEQQMHELRVGELGVAQREPHAVHRVVGEPPDLHQGGAGSGDRVPGA
ncbi:hypothetical protein G3M58_71430 [Streptomyces sp. SID7499]|uniref:Uncharacterized protein n=1 Tax=Streptomyces sp. SID7499 TaxID=2706086 RepID=A0A6G3XM59_9ACTN|nr:hypothetical protein [Streptomyces sp. SID7499]